jgi:hypothetical protein
MTENPDPKLARAGFVLAAETEGLREHAKDFMGTIIASPEFKSLQSDDERTRYLRKKIPNEMSGNLQVKKAVCEKLREFSSDLGIQIVDCWPRE